jgi:hypothetical protein
VVLALWAVVGAWAQTTTGQSVVFHTLFTKQSSLGRSVVFGNVQGLGITNHVVTWTVTGGPTTCTVLIEKSTDAVTWATESTETCTTNGSKTLADASYNYLTVNLSALSGGTNPTLTVEHRGYLPGQGIPVRPGEGGTGTTTAFTAGSVPFAGASGVHTQNNAQFFWNNASLRLCLLSNSCVNTFDVGAGKAFITASGAGTFGGGLTAKADAAGNVASTVQGFSGQTANLHDWKNSAGTVLASVDKAGIPKGNRLDNSVPLHGTVKADFTVTTVANTVTETALNSYSIPANTLAANRTLRVTATGTYSTANGTDTVTLRARVAATAWHSIVSTGATVTNAQWSASWVIVAKTIAVAGDAESQLPWAFINSVFKSDPNTAVETIDTTLARTLDLTAQWSAALAGNTISVRQFVVEVLN